MSLPATAPRTHPPGQHPDPPPPGSAGWLRANLFSSVFNTALTL